MEVLDWVSERFTVSPFNGRHSNFSRFAIWVFVSIILINSSFAICEIVSAGEGTATDYRITEISGTLEIKATDSRGDEMLTTEDFAIDRSSDAAKLSEDDRFNIIFKYTLNFAMQTILYTIIILWLLFDARFKESLDSLENNYPDKPTYRDLLKSYNAHRSHCNKKPEDTPSAKRIKKFVGIAWTIATVLFLCLIITLGCVLKFNPFITLLSIVLLIISMLLNHTSYFLCFVYVWFLEKFSKISDLEKYPFLRQMPSKTGVFLKMKRYANENAIIFLVVTLLFTIAIGISLMLLNKYRAADQGWTLYWSLVSLVILAFGIFSFISLFAFSKVFLSTVLNRWKHASSAQLEPEANRAFQSIVNQKQLQLFKVTNEMTEVIQNIYSKQSPHLLDLAAVILALLQLTASVSKNRFALSNQASRVVL
jgi:hypothetical protein